MNTTSKYDFTKAEADTGIPTPQITTYERRPILHTPNIKASEQGLVLTSEAQIGEWVSGTVAHSLDASTSESIFYWWIMRPTKSIFLFKEDPAKQIRSKKVYVSISSDSTTLPDPVFENTRMFLQMLAADYSAGRIDIAGIVQRLGEPWTESTVVRLLEILGAHRPVSIGHLSQQEQDNILRRLAQIRATSDADEFNSTDWIQREVIASQRIESVFVSPDDLSNNKA